MNREKRWSRAEKKLLWISGGAIAFMALFGVAWNWLNAMPEVDIPTPKMPEPNGYDYFIQAGAAYVPANPPIALGPSDIAGPAPPISNLPPAKLYSTAAKEAWLRRNAKSLSLLRQGLQYQAQHPPVRSAGYQFPHLSRFRRMADMLVIESRARAERGNWKDAAESAIDCVDFGCKISRGGPLILGLTGVSVQGKGTRELQGILSHLDARTSRHAAKRIERIQQDRATFANALREEKWATQAFLLDLMKQGNWRQTFEPLVCGPSVSWRQQLKVRFMSKTTVMKKYSQSMDAFISNVQRPYVRQQPDSMTGDIVLDRLVPSVHRNYWVWTRTETGNVLIMNMLALRAYQLEKGRCPTKLDELVPEYLKQLPKDPFSEGKPLRFQPRGQEYSLWSIGPDGVDNGGKPIINPDKNNRYLVFQESKGDIGAGVNTPPSFAASL